jgi:hypothetical protein|tara:strand:+ start:22006 stop:22188 length:183 start_codon:yes stop_codon:yes gene_type:complete
MTIETSIFDSLIAVTFENTATGQIDTIICADRHILAEQLSHIEESDHLTLICATDAAIAR